MIHLTGLSGLLLKQHTIRSLSSSNAIGNGWSTWIVVFCTHYIKTPFVSGNWDGLVLHNSGFIYVGGTQDHVDWFKLTWSRFVHRTNRFCIDLAAQGRINVNVYYLPICGRFVFVLVDKNYMSAWVCYCRHNVAWVQPVKFIPLSFCAVSIFWFDFNFFCTKVKLVKPTRPLAMKTCKKGALENYKTGH